jgi:hypothetical protein
VNEKYGIWSMKTTIYANNYQFGPEKTTGIALAQDVGLEPFGNRISMMLHAVLYNTEGWNNRIYLWEKDLPGSFSMPMLYGQGCRMAFYVKYELKDLRIQVKFSDSVQPGMESLGDGAEQIMGDRRTEARLQLSLKF